MSNYYNPQNYYNSNPSLFGNPFTQQQTLQNQQQQPQMLQNQMSMMQNNFINGKIVDSEDVVKVTEVPIGGYGVFPRADLSEIYFKTWNNNGTTSVITYRPVLQQQPAQSQEEIINRILQKVESLENKINEISKLYPVVNATQPECSVEKIEEPKRKEVNLSDY